MSQKEILPNNSFYNQLAVEYDEMISFEKAVDKKKRVFKDIVEAGMKCAADLGCGTGVDSIAIASIGINVVAFDPSDEMLKIAIENVEKKKVNVSFHNYRIDEIPDKFNDQFDIVVSLGNTFANIEKEKLNESLKKSFKILKPGGTLLIQVLNYEKILSEKERIVNVTEGKDKYYIRFYDFINNEIVFNILKIDKRNLSDYNLTSTFIYPHTQTDFITAFKKLGLNTVQYFSDYEQTQFDKQLSKDLVIKAQKI